MNFGTAVRFIPHLLENPISAFIGHDCNHVKRGKDSITSIRVPAVQAILPGRLHPVELNEEQ